MKTPENRLFGTVMGSAVGVALLTATIVLFGRVKPDQKTLDTIASLTTMGRQMFCPEREIPIYVGGCALSVALCLTLSFLPKKRGNAKLGIAALVGTLALLLFWGKEAAENSWQIASLYILPLGCLAAGAYLKKGKTDPIVAPETPKQPMKVTVLDLLFMLIPTLLLFTPNSTALVEDYRRIEMLHHWNYFVAGPATAYAQGGALITEYYAQYGVAWPVVMHWLAMGGTASYELMLSTFTTYACIYFAVLYVFLRRLTEDPVTALAGTMLALLVQPFLGAADTVWHYPSSTIVRSPLDVWVFLLLLAQARKPRTWIAGAIGCLAGAAVLFEIDTGIYLTAATVGIFMPSTLDWETREGRKRGAFQIATGAAFFIGTLLCGLEIASRGTWTLSKAGLEAWAEGALAQSGAVGLLPIAKKAGWVIAGFAAAASIYIGVTAKTLILRMQGRLSPESATVGTIAAYGLAGLLLFVGRSAGYNLFHPLIPLAIIAAWTIKNKRQWGYFVIGAATVGIACTTGFRTYPNIMHQGLPWLTAPKTEKEAGREAALTEIIAYAKEWKKAGETFACLDRGDTIIYLQSETRPWGRYTPSFPILTENRMGEVLAKLKQTRPDWIVNGREWDQTQAVKESALENDHTLTKIVGDYQIWKRK